MKEGVIDKMVASDTEQIKETITDNDMNNINKTTWTPYAEVCMAVVVAAAARHKLGIAVTLTTNRQRINWLLFNGRNLLKIKVLTLV